MIRFLAIDFNQTPAAAVVARVHKEKPIEIVSVGQLELSSLTENGSENEASETQPLELNIELPDGGIDKAFAVINNSELVYASVELPFNDPKKIAQVVPLQLQDSLPFDVSECVMDNTVAIKTNDTYRIISALSPTESVVSAIGAMSAVGYDPIKLSTHASALTELYQASISVSESKPEEGLIVLVNIQPSFVALVILLDSQACLFREWNHSGDNKQERAISEIQASIASCEITYNSECSKIYVLGSNEALVSCKTSLPATVEMLDFKELVQNHTNTTLALDKYCWAIGLASQEKTQSTEGVQSFDFRQGPFAYRRAWRDFWEAISNELTYIVLAIVFLIALVGTKWWAVHNELTKVEQEIGRIASVASTSEIIPNRGEVQFFESAIEEREEQLLEMGSLASLSPLESLRLLSSTIKPNISIEVDSITIGFSRILLRGSVKDTPTMGTLESALKGPSKQFCSVKVDPKGRESGSSRQRFTAEITVCE